MAQSSEYGLQSAIEILRSGSAEIAENEKGWYYAKIGKDG